jgi:hypothetical protein
MAVQYTKCLLQQGKPPCEVKIKKTTAGTGDVRFKILQNHIDGIKSEGSERTWLSPHQVGIITPYRKQVEKIRLMLNKIGLSSSVKVCFFILYLGWISRGLPRR